jgi:hypothetical protein
MSKFSKHKYIKFDNSNMSQTNSKKYKVLVNENFCLSIASMTWSTIA